MFFFVYLTQYIFQCIERNTPFSNLLIFVGIACLLHMVVHFMCAWYVYYLKVRTPKVYEYILLHVMDRASDISLEEYENPEFYDRYARALDECVDQGMDLLITLGIFIGNVIATIMTLILIGNVDPILLLFMLIPLITSTYFGKKSSKNNYEMKQKITRDKRIAEYTNRVFYEKQYA